MAVPYLKSVLGRPITIEESDDNFIYMSDFLSTTPEFQGVFPFLPNSVVQFSVSNFDTNSYYWSDLTNFNFDKNGNFSGYVTSGVNNLLAMNVGKKSSTPASIPFQEHEVVTGSSEAYQYANSSLYSGNSHYLSIPVGDLLATADYRFSLEDSIYIKSRNFEIYTYYTDGYNKQTSTVSVLRFESSETIADYITAYLPDGSNREIYTVGNTEDIIPSPDIFGDGSCVDMWSLDTFPVLENQVRSSNTIDLTNSLATQLLDGKYGKAITWDESDTGEYNSLLNNTYVTTDMPLTITLFVKNGSSSESVAPFEIAYGGVGERYNFEYRVSLMTYSGGPDFWVTRVRTQISSHKRGYNADIYYDHVHTEEEGATFGWHLLSIRREAGKFVSLFDGDIVIGELVDNITFKFNPSKPFTLTTYDGGTGTDHVDIDHIRVFNRNLTSDEYQKLLFESGKKVSVSPVLSSVPLKVTNGRLFDEVSLDSVVVSPVSAVLSDTTTYGHDAKWTIEYPVIKSTEVPTVNIRKYQNSKSEEKVYIEAEWTQSL